MSLLTAKFEDQQALGAEVTRIAGYPRVTPKMFEQSYLLQDITVDSKNPNSFKHNKAVTINIVENSVQVEKTGMVPLPGNPSVDAPKVPTYTVRYTTEDGVEHVMENRFAFIGLGSNSSPKVLAAKFGPQKFIDENDQPYKDVTCPVIMAKLDDHAIVYSAFLGGAGSVPLTMAAEQGTAARISVAFYDENQVKRINSSEPNYDVVTLKKPKITINSGQALDVMPCVYESIWGPLRSPQGYMLTCDQIPHNPIKSQIISSMGAMRQAVNVWKNTALICQNTPFEQAIMDHKTPTKAMFPDLSESERGAEKKARGDHRVYLNSFLPHLPRSLDATVIQPATLAGAREMVLAMHINAGRQSNKRALKA